MKLSLNWLKEYCQEVAKYSPEELANFFTLAGHEVEKIERLKEKWDKIIIGQVLKIKPHPNASKLVLAEVDLGGTKKEIVCGGTNLREGMLVPVALPGAKVYWHGKKELLEIKEAEVRGIKSHGMICAASEIFLEDVFENKEGEILDLSWSQAKVGEELAKVLGLDDIIFDLDITPNRGDAMCVFGLARELKAILGKKISLPDFQKLPKLPKNKLVQVKVFDKQKCPFYSALVVQNVSVSPSPLWLKVRLSQAGIRPINNIVDITNYLMLEFGQPLHAFDFDKISRDQKEEKTIFVRQAFAQEKILCLDEKERTLSNEDLLIADYEKPLAVAGVIGGKNSEINDRTQNIVLEAALFDHVAISKTYRRLEARTESAIRFERQIDPALTEKILEKAGQMIIQLAGGKIVQKIVIGDPRFKRSYPRSLALDISRINQIIGIDLPLTKIKKIFLNLGFQIRQMGKKLKVFIPSWRNDLQIPEDLIEEVARIYGYNRLPITYLYGESKPGPEDKIWSLSEFLKDELVKLGFSEIQSYSFYGDEITKGFIKEKHFELANPLNPNQIYLRRSLLPWLFYHASNNLREVEEVKFFEIGRVFWPEIEGREKVFLAGILASKKMDRLSLWRLARGFFETLLRNLNLNEELLQYNLEENGLTVKYQNQELGFCGLLEKEKLEAYKIKTPLSFFQIDLDILKNFYIERKTFSPLPRFPEVERDLSILVDEKISWKEIENAVRESGGQFLQKIFFFDYYKGEGIPSGLKSLAFRLVFRAEERTLTSEEVDQFVRNVIQNLKEKFNIELRA